MPVSKTVKIRPEDLPLIDAAAAARGVTVHAWMRDALVTQARIDLRAAAPRGPRRALRATSSPTA